MQLQLTEAESERVNKLYELYKFARPGRSISLYTEMVSLILGFVEKYDEEFEEFLATNGKTMRDAAEQAAMEYNRERA